MVKRFSRVAFAIGMAILLTAATLRLLGPLNAGLVRLRQDFRPHAAFSLNDSLPALSPGLSNLEAFSVTLSPGTLASADRSLWWADSVDTVRFAFHTDRTPFDSAALYLWSGDTVHSRVLRRRGSFDWKVPVWRRIEGWSEMVAMYASWPPLFRMRAADTSVAVFERLEGGVSHVLSDAYARLSETSLPPDTAYLARGMELQLLARGTTLAVSNPTPRALRIRLLRVEQASPLRLHVPPRTVHVYRRMLDRSTTTLAYTGAGEPFCRFGSCHAPEAEFFRLAPRSSE